MVENIVAFHEEMGRIFTMKEGVRDLGLLESAVSVPFQSFGGVELYPSVIEKAARLCYGLAKNHPFFDGNKRTAIHTMLVYLAVSGYTIDADEKELEKLIIDIASGCMEINVLEAWLEYHLISKKERSLPRDASDVPTGIKELEEDMDEEL